MLNLSLGAFGFRTTFEITLEKILPPLPLPGAAPKPGDPPAKITTLKLPTVVAVTRAFFDADIEVVMSDPTSASTFDLTIHGLDPLTFELIDPQTTIVHISLGYADGASSELLAGLVLEKSITAGNCMYDVKLKGTDFVFDQLKNPRTPSGGMNYQSPANSTIGAIAKDLCGKVNVPVQVVKVDGPSLKGFALLNITPLVLLQELAKRAQQPDQPADVQVQVKDGTVWLGAPSQIGSDHPTPISDGGATKPLTASGSSAAASAPDGQDFDIPGDPTLRPNDTVRFGDNKKSRIHSITHSLTSERGYRCTGRALSPDATAADQFKASRPSAAQVARTIQDNLIQRERRRPAVSAGEIDAYSADTHTTSVKIGTAATPDMTNPTVQAPLIAAPVTLTNKPMASAFAFDKCGLVVPVYQKMRALLVHGWHDPNDAVVDGFLWTSTMSSPPNQPGDWWLCLPTQFNGDGLPDGPTADDLITGAGQRVISVKGMKITVGAGLQTSAGTRPDPPTDESLTVQTDQGAMVTLKGGQIQITDGAVTLTVGNGKVSIG